MFHKFTTAFILFGIVVLSACGAKEKKFVQMAGYAQGTTYHISYLETNGTVYTAQVDSILNVIDFAMSTYNKASDISIFNQSDTSITIGKHFQEVLKKAMQIAELTKGDFDITVGPLVNAWGFGANPKVKGDVKPEEILDRVGYQKVQLNGAQLSKTHPALKLDVNAIAQGYSVDVIAAYLESNGIIDYMVELGGEIRCSGRNADNNLWRIGIDKPSEEIEQERYQAIVQLDNKALATSGNYRKFYVDENGMKYVHTINPHTGYPVKSNLLSASVIAPDAMSADAFATTFMVMGLEKSIAFAKQHEDIYVYLVYVNKKGEWETYISPEMEKLIIN